MIETIIVIDQKASEITPYTFAGVAATACWSMEKTVCIEYRGLVPMSPNTMPKAPSISGARRRPEWLGVSSGELVG